MSEQFISQPLQPVTESIDPTPMAAGEPGLPGAFTLNGERIEVLELVRKWKEHGPCSHGSGERYLQKHWYELRTRDHGVLKVCFQRQPKSARDKNRWILYTRTI